VPRSSDPRSDAALLLASQCGDPAAFDALYARYRNLVAAWAERFTDNSDDALDVFQDTFQCLLEKMPDLSLSGRLSSLLFPIVRSLAADIHRRNGRRRIVERAASVPAAQRDDDTFMRREALAAVVAGLPGFQRCIVLMRFVDGLSLEEIAAALGVPVGTVKSRLHYAVERLRRDPRCRSYLLEMKRASVG